MWMKSFDARDASAGVSVWISARPLNYQAAPRLTERTTRAFNHKKATGAVFLDVETQMFKFGTKVNRTNCARYPFLMAFTT
jgi:hypothetical protein